MLSKEYQDNIARDFLLCKVVCSLLGNIADGFDLCNSVPRVLRQNYTGFFYAMLPGASRTLLHVVFTCEMLSQEYLGKIAQGFFMQCCLEPFWLHCIEF